MKKAIALVVGLFIMCSFASFSTFAEESDTVAKIGDQAFASLQDAVDSITDNTTATTIVLQKNTEGDGVKVPSGKNIISILMDAPILLITILSVLPARKPTGFSCLKDQQLLCKTVL